MKLEDQVCSLELAKRLKELGVKQDSLFYWVKESEPYIWYNSQHFPMQVEKWSYSAFTVAELCEILSSDFQHANRQFNIEIHKIHKRHKIECQFVFIAGYWNRVPQSKRATEFDWCLHQSESLISANSLAQELIYLFEDGFMNKDSTANEVK